MKKEGDRRICPQCRENGINIEIICKKIVFKGEERLSWRNPDGTAHFDPVEDSSGNVTYQHTPTVMTAFEVWKMEIEERLSRVERGVGIQCLD